VQEIENIKSSLQRIVLIAYPMEHAKIQTILLKRLVK